MWIPVLCLLAVAAADQPKTNAADDMLNEVFKQHLEEQFAQHPLGATRQGDHRFDHLLDDVSPAARAKWPKRIAATLEKLRAIDVKSLSRGSQIDYEIFVNHLTYQLWASENVKPFEQDPRTYNEYISESVFSLLTQSTQPKAVNIRNSIARMGQIPQVVAAAKASLKHPPRAVLETAITQNRGSILFYERGIYAAAGESAQLSLLRPAAEPVVVALKEYQSFLEKELLARADGDWRIGKEKFARKLEFELDAGISADEVLAEAQVEFDRVRRDMYVLARQMWGQLFPKQPLPPDDVPGRAETIRAVLAQLGKRHSKPDELLKDARDSVGQIKSFISQHDILRLPEPDRCQVIEMPEFQRGNSVAYLSPAPPLDPQAASLYAVSPPPKEWEAARANSLLEEYNQYMLQILTIHEAYPGHYVQLEYSNRHPSLIRRILSSGTFAEGWAVYTEQMMLDQGYGQTDPALRMNQLKFYLRAVANAILDHNMHCTQMTDDEALSFLVNEAFQSDGEARLKIVRAKQTSCQLSTYFVGRMAFYRLRQTIQREQGKEFDLGRYHEAVLANGTLPVKYLPELTRERLKSPR